LNFFPGKDADNFSVGGILGYNFQNYKFDQKKIDSGSNDAEQLILKLKTGRIDHGISQLKKDETFKKIFKKYGITVE